jgi:hypothetical protein
MPSMSRNLMAKAVFSDRLGGAQELPDAAGEVALEAADRLAVGLAFRGLAVDVGAALRVAAGASDRDAMDRGVDLAVAAAIETVAVGAPGTDRDRRQPSGAGELGVGREAVGAGDLADELGGGLASTVARQDPATFRRFSRELQKREPRLFKPIPYKPGRGTRGCVPRVAAAGDPTSELIELLFDVVRHGHAHFGHQLYAPLKDGRGFGVVLLGVSKERTIDSVRPPGGRIIEHLSCTKQADGNLAMRLCAGTLYLDVRDASETAGVWELDADASRYTKARLQDLAVEELEAALLDSTGPLGAFVPCERKPAESLALTPACTSRGRAERSAGFHAEREPGRSLPLVAHSRSRPSPGESAEFTRGCRTNAWRPPESPSRPPLTIGLRSALTMRRSSCQAAHCPAQPQSQGP